MSTDIRQGKGSGYRTESGRICMIRCFECGRENYAPNVASGSCAFCHFDPNRPPERKRREEEDDSILGAVVTGVAEAAIEGLFSSGSDSSPIDTGGSDSGGSWSGGGGSFDGGGASGDF